MHKVSQKNNALPSQIHVCGETISALSPYTAAPLPIGTGSLANQTYPRQVPEIGQVSIVGPEQLSFQKNKAITPLSELSLF